MEIKPDVLKKLREPFPPSQIGKLPKGGIFLDFVGHGFLTARFLDADPEWNWRPMAYDERGLPLFDEFGGLWMYLTIGGVERIGYGDASGKKGPNAVKEAIGDALRNAGMRFGAALELWQKGDPDAPEPVDPRIEEANAARAELLKMLSSFGWNAKTLMTRFKDDYDADLREAEAETVRTFAKLLKEEAEEQLRDAAND